MGPPGVRHPGEIAGEEGRVTYDDRLVKVMALRRRLARYKDRMVSLAVKNLNFTVKDSAREVDVTIDRLGMFEEAASFLRDRMPLRGPGSSVSLMLSYNGSAWLNTAITSIYLVGNRVHVKFASRGSDVMSLTEEIYRPLFGDRITFYKGSGRDFVDASLRDPDTSAVVVFGFDDNVAPYEEAFRRGGKKLVFEGPGQDPFIVFRDADLDEALSDLLAAKFMYSGQTCTAPKRIFLQRPIHDAFLARVADAVRRLRIGDPRDRNTDITPVASDLAVDRIRRQLQDAVHRGATIVAGGTVEGNLVHPTVVRDATDEMLGMREEVFGPVVFTTPFDTEAEVLRRARDHKYGLRAAVFGGPGAARTAEALRGEPYCHPVDRYVYGRFGTVALNQSRAESWRGAFVTKAVGGYGRSGWIWETVAGMFRMKQGPKLLSVETSAAS
jgi:acyl-CoA reductase-like NAD-dependent aldehyde dehydrogenase